MPLDDRMYASNALHNIALELLMRKNPQARETTEIWTAINKRKGDARRKWEKEIIALEGEEGLRQRKIEAKKHQEVNIHQRN